MLLGHDLLYHWGVIHDMRTDTLLVDEERLQLNTKFKEDVNLRSDYCIEPMNYMYLEVPRTLRKKDTDPVLCLINPSDRYHTIKKGKVSATAVKIEGLIINEVQTIQTPHNRNTIPSRASPEP